MSRVFADTAFLIASVDPRDQHAEDARLAYSRLSKPIVHTSQGVLSELLAHFSADLWLRKAALSSARRLIANPNVLVHPWSTQSFDAAMDRYAARMDKHYSLVDCDAMNIMDRESLQMVLSSDIHFAQEGFETLF